MSGFSYNKVFDPADIDVDPEADVKKGLADDQIYVFANDYEGDETGDQIVLAINAAIVTHRPLLVYGPPGSGKSSLAPNIARRLGIPFHSRVIDSRTEVQDLLWRFDAVRRLSDAHAAVGVKNDKHYIERGVLWDAFTASQRDATGKPSCVVLLDEIDKADPDLPNGLLGPLGSLSFPSPDGGPIQPAGNPPLVVITSNNERELSRPFLRRCIVLTLRPPTQAHLVKVAKARFGANKPEKSDAIERYERIADFVVTVSKNAQDRRQAPPSTAEYLDAVRACERLNISLDDPAWAVLSRVVLTKPDLRT
jgi:MoxR-like ATPase